MRKEGSTGKKPQPLGRRWGGRVIRPGERASVSVQVTESYLGLSVPIPMHVWRGKEEGPTVLISAAVHGDEINGVGAIRDLIADAGFEPKRGTLVLVPVVNVLGFERHERYLPDRRDLNRSFPGTKSGSMASRLARVVFDKVIKRCDFSIDLHTAAVRRTNFPNVRGDMSNAGVRRLARAFGCEVILDSPGPDGSMRNVATKAGCPSLILEAGEVWKVEPSVVAYTLRGIRNVLIELGMIEGEPQQPPYRVVIGKTTWVRSSSGGFLKFHVSPGDLVEEGQPLATNGDLLGNDHETIAAPESGLILGMTTMPSVAPGDPIVHIAVPDAKQLGRIKRGISDLDDESLGAWVRSDLASSVLTSEGPDLDPDPDDDTDEM